MASQQSKRVDSRRRFAPCSVDGLETRELLSMGVSFTDRSVRTVSDSVGKVVVKLQASVVGLDSSATTPITVDLTTGGGSAIPGVDYTPVQQSISFGPNETSKEVEIPILPGSASLGTRVLKISVSPTPANPAGASEYVVIQHGEDRTPPTVVASKALTKNGRVVAFSVTFSEDMAIDSVQNVANYAIGDPASLKVNARLGWTGMTRNIALKSATYDAASRTVVLVPAGKVKNFPFYTILDPGSNAVLQAITTATINKPPVFVASISALTDRSGNPITAISTSDDGGGTNGTLSASATSGKAGQAILNLINGTTATKAKTAKR